MFFECILHMALELPWYHCVILREAGICKLHMCTLSVPKTAPRNHEASIAEQLVMSGMHGAESNRIESFFCGNCLHLASTRIDNSYFGVGAAEQPWADQLRYFQTRCFAFSGCKHMLACTELHGTAI
jgi:hypothetical protein